MTQKRYTFTVACSFTMQHTLDESEIELDPDGNETDVEPTARALLALARELEGLLYTHYPVSDVDASSDSARRTRLLTCSRQAHRLTDRGVGVVVGRAGARGGRSQDQRTDARRPAGDEVRARHAHHDGHHSRRRAGRAGLDRRDDHRRPHPAPARARQTPTERTDVKLLYDEANLYIGVAAHDTSPRRVIGTQMARDASLGSDDRIEILLDTYRDQRSAFYFATNPSGALVDGLVFANGQLNTDWDAIWYVRTTRTNEGWFAEFAIPFKSLSFPAGRTGWGFNISRTIYRKLEDVRWSGARLEMPFLQVSEAGEITDLDGLTQGHRPRRAAVPGRTLAARGSRGGRRMPPPIPGSTSSTTSRRA